METICALNLLQNISEKRHKENMAKRDMSYDIVVISYRSFFDSSTLMSSGSVIGKSLRKYANIDDENDIEDEAEELPTIWL